ncbi:MAG: DUF3301 domain-containing protein [Xanthomonadales bacterium]|nr:DUF3301 domain-containing protein [Xanthomonadales bacterium]
MTGLLILVFTALAGIAWWRLSQGKEMARHAASAVCRQHGLVLMDDTVMLRDVQLRQEDPVRAWGFKYQFEFARNGVLHQGGTVLLTPGHGATVVIATDNGQLIERV